MNQESTCMFEIRDILGVQQEYREWVDETHLSLNLDLFRTSHSALNSVTPHSTNHLSADGSLEGGSGVFLSPLHRQVLLSAENNLAGLGEFPREKLLLLLKEVSSLKVIRLILSTPCPSSQSIAQSLLKSAIEIGDGNMVEEILSYKALEIDLNQEICEARGERYTAIERASMLRHKEVIKVMLRHRVDVHKTYSCIHTPTISGCDWCPYSGALDCAIRGTSYPYTEVDPEIFNMILNSVRSVTTESLSFLTYHKHGEFVLDVVSKFAATHHREWKGLSRLWSDMILLLREDTSTRIVDIMHSVGADISTKLLNAAAEKGHQALLRKFLNQYRLSPDKRTLCCAVKSGNENLVRYLLEHGTTVHDALDGKVITPLSEAILLQNYRMMRVLEEKGAYERFDEWPPFHAAWMAAVTIGDQVLVKKLISMRKNIPADALGYALSKVSSNGDYEAAVMLLNLGADLEATSSEAWNRSKPALVEAIRSRNVPLINLLLDSGANPNNYEFGGRSPIVLAAEWGDHSVVEALLMAGVKPTQDKDDFIRDQFQGSKALATAVKRKDKILASMLLEAGADINYRALEAATEIGDFDITKWLLDRGADPHDSQALKNAFLNNSSLFELLLKAHKDRYSLKRKGFGSAVLCNAIRSGRKTVVKSLLDHRADPNQFVYLDGQYVTPFFCAIAADEGRDTSLVKDFIKAGCIRTAVSLS